ncbi:transposase [Frankia sp. Cj3]|uniref:transposase n=1 Tax=Frankia sp. Cj3 TaxID=2880976 RepID=UPI001EF4F3F9|nr:transposase [Frankia sp. Cj3]
MQAKLHRWAAADPGRRFDDLYNFVCDPATLLIAYRRVAGNRSARTAGVDGLTVADVERETGVPGFLDDLRAHLKADPSDAAFLARAGASAMVMASFVPERKIRELWDLTRRRTELARAAGWEAQRLEKELEDTGMKLAAVLTDLVGVTGREILEALVAGERDPHLLADFAVGRARAKIPALVEALDCEFTDHHAFTVRHFLDEIDRWKQVIASFDERIATLLADHQPDLDLLDTIPGVGRLAAEIIIAETSGDMAQFPSAHHLA